MLDQYACAQEIGERIALYRGERAARSARAPFDPMRIAVARQLYVSAGGKPLRTFAREVMPEFLAV